jgi:hypothetical protein
MATLIVLDDILWHDAGTVVLTPETVDLGYIDDPFHTHVAESLWVVKGDSSWHDHVANGGIILTYEHYLDVSPAYHDQVADEPVVTMNVYMWTDGQDPPELPVLELTAQGETRLSGLSGGSKLPGLVLSIRSGARCGDGVLPAIGLSATASSDHLMSVSGRLPTMSLSARSGAICGDLKLPVPELSVTAIGDLVGRLTKTMPGLSISATGSTPVLGSLTKGIPPLELVISMSGTVGGVLIGSLSGLKLTGAASLNEYGTLSRDIPVPIVLSMTGHRSSIDISMTLPTLIMSGVGTGVVDPGGGGGYNASRFDDYVLRYAR